MKKEIIPEIIRMPKEDVSIDFRDAPKWMGQDIRDAIVTARRMHEYRQRSMEVCVVSSVFAGFALLGIKREAGHGRWEEVRARYFDSVMSERTGRTYMQIAEEVRHTVARRAALPPTRLLGCAGLEQTEIKRVEAAIIDTVGVKPIREILADITQDNRGGYRPQQDLLKRFCKTPEALKLLLSPETWENWTKAQQQMFRDWAQAERLRQEQEAAAQDPLYHHKRRETAAIRQWEPVITQVKIAVEGKDSWSALPPEKKIELRDKLRSWADLIEKTLAATAG